MFGTSSVAEMAGWQKAISLEAMKANAQQTMSALSLSGADSIVFKGWLFKRRRNAKDGTGEGSWRKRFFVLYTNGSLAHFEDEDMQLLTGELRLDADSLIEPAAGTPERPQSCKFKVCAGTGRVLQLMSKTQDVASSWMTSIARIRSSLGGLPGTQGEAGLEYHNPNKVTVRLPDGSSKTVVVREGMTVNMVCLAVGDNLGLKVKSFSGLGLFECIESTEMRLLSDGELLSNVLRRWNDLSQKCGKLVTCCLVLRVVVMPEPIPPPEKDAVLCSMLFHQIRHQVLDFVPVNVEEAIQASSKLLSYEMARSSDQQLPTPERLAMNIASVMPKMITSAEMRNRPDTALAAAVLNAMPAYQEHEHSVTAAMNDFLHFALDYFPLSHGEMYSVSPTGEWSNRLPRNCIVVVNTRGIHILDSDQDGGMREWVTSIPYHDVLRYGSSTHRLAIFITMDDDESSKEHKIEFLMKQEGRASEVVMLARAHALQSLEM